MAWPVRYKLVGLLASGSAINYADRGNISVAAPAMMASLGWDEARFGIIFSTFSWGTASCKSLPEPWPIVGAQSFLSPGLVSDSRYSQR
jgi:hypothetical protein